MSAMLGKIKNSSSSRKSIVLIQIGTKSPSYPATAIGTIGTNSATKKRFSATTLFRFSATNSPRRAAPPTLRCLAASACQIRYQTDGTARSSPHRNTLPKLFQIRPSEQLFPRKPSWDSAPLPSQLRPSVIWDSPGCPSRNTQPKLLQIRRSEQVYRQRHRPGPASSPFQLRLPAARNALTYTYRNTPQSCSRYKHRNNAWRSSLLPFGGGEHWWPIEQVPTLLLVRDSYDATRLESAS